MVLSPITLGILKSSHFVPFNESGDTVTPLTISITTISQVIWLITQAGVVKSTLTGGIYTNLFLDLKIWGIRWLLQVVWDRKRRVRLLRLKKGYLLLWLEVLEHFWVRQCFQWWKTQFLSFGSDLVGVRRLWARRVSTSKQELYVSWDFCLFELTFLSKDVLWVR